MTNWMTTAGIALIAGGIATLIVFRRIIWSGRARPRGSQAVAQAPGRSRKRTRDDRSRTREGSRRGEPARVRPVLPAQAGPPDISGSQQAADILAGLAASDERAAAEEGGLASLGLADDDDPIEDGDGGAAARRRRPRGGPMDMDDLRRQLRDALEDLKRERPYEPEPAGRDPGEMAADDAEQRRISRAVLARADAGTREGARFDPASGQLVPPAVTGPAPGQDPRGPRPSVRAGEDPTRTRPGEALGDRVDGWIRPQYGTPEGPTGDYWMPVPDAAYVDDSSAYGWPVPVERLPAAPAYPAHDYAAIEESEPTAVVPQWPPARPYDRIEVPRTWSVRRWDTDAAGRDVWRAHNVADVSRRRPSPRPNAGADLHSTVYVSRHAAEPT